MCYPSLQLKKIVDTIRTQGSHSIACNINRVKGVGTKILLGFFAAANSVPTPDPKFSPVPMGEKLNLGDQEFLMLFLVGA